MTKRMLILLIVITTFVMLSSCSYEKWKTLYEEQPDLMGTVSVVSEDDSGKYYVEYEGQRYNRDISGLFVVRKTHNEIPTDDLLIGWDSLPLGIWYIDEYYSYTADAPIFIYAPRISDIYLREDYNYQADTFIIEGTEEIIVFSDLLTTSSELSYDAQSRYEEERDIILYSEQCPRLQIQLRIFRFNDTWYAVGNNTKFVFEVSDELLPLLNIES